MTENEYEEDRARQIRENEEFLASLGIDKLVTRAPKATRRAPKKQSEEGEYKPEHDYHSRIRTRTHKVSYAENNKDIYRSAGSSSSKKIKKSGPHRPKGRDLGRRIINNRVYDSKLGTSCHQCRQKTMDTKIKCSSDTCNIMFDYHCLFVRYDEDAKIIDYSEWLCPKCRGVCNCSFCMKKRGKAPTGQLSTFIKHYGEDAVKKAIMCDTINGRVLSPTKARARRRVSYEDTYGDEDEDINGDNTAACSDQGTESTSPKRQSARLANSSARKKIAALVDDSDDSNDSDNSCDSDSDGATMASWDKDGDDDYDTVDRAWNGWKSCPAAINCIVLVESNVHIY
ncbi:hypothetical protein IWW38_004891 [Coemansia aciculifera]|uniref:Uncharacterized protein n=1 Tax=Coemansia aciculifera TaxID=417176 RepID=A0ACC1LY98_9FUNG|nr:hypothetical protein IWW38_004891 [Coemansia aciculifera]